MELLQLSIGKTAPPAGYGNDLQGRDWKPSNYERIAVIEVMRVRIRVFGSGNGGRPKEYC